MLYNSYTSCLLSDKFQGTETKALLVQTVEDIDGNKRSLSEFAGKVAVVVNVASSCGFTESNYRGLQFLYDKYKDYDFTVSCSSLLQVLSTCLHYCGDMLAAKVLNATCLIKCCLL